MKEGDAAAIVEEHGIHLAAVAGSDLPWGAAADIHPPKVATIDVALISREQDKRFVGRQRDVFYFEITWRQFSQPATFGRDRIEMHPALFFRRKKQTIAGYPLPEIAGGASRIPIVLLLA